MGMWQWILAAVGAVACVTLLVQDLRGRWVHLVPVLALAGAGIAFCVLGNSPDWWLDLVVEYGFLVLVLGLTIGVMRILRPGTRILNQMLGIGDILMFFAVVGWMDALGFALYFVSGLIWVLLGVLGLQVLGRWKADMPIPLAGLLAGYLLAFAPAYWHWGQALRCWLDLC